MKHYFGLPSLRFREVFVLQEEVWLMLPDVVIAEVLFFVAFCAGLWAWLLLTFFKTLSEFLALKVLFWREFFSFCLKNGVFM